MKRWLIAAAALLAGGGVSAALLVAADPARSAVDVYAAAHDLPAGAALSIDAIQLRRVRGVGGATFLYTRGDEARLLAMRAAYGLAPGQLIQTGGVMGLA